jgi:hypothetical protein
MKGGAYLKGRRAGDQLSLGIEADGKKAQLDLTYRLDSVNRAIAGL